MKKVGSVFIFLSLFLAFPSESFAIVRRALPNKPVAKKAVGSAVISSVRFRFDRRAVILSISNLPAANSISYLLTYTSSGKAEGTQGVIRPTGESATTRELLFGTCSTGVCTYHRNIQNARLVLTINQTNGKIVRRAYKLKV